MTNSGNLHDPNERAAFRYMDAFRFIAAFVVVINHSRDLVAVDADQAGNLGVLWKAVYFVAGLGHEAVMVFFVLSGFWITKSVERKITTDRFWSEYLTDRLSRLMIVIIPALLIGGLLDFIGSVVIGAPHYFGLTGANSAQANVPDNLSPVVFFGNVAFLQSLMVPPFGSNGPLWSLAYEFWFYVWFAALALLSRRRVSIALGALVIGVIWPKVALGFCVWLMGSLLFYADRHFRDSLRPMGIWASWAAALATSGLLAIALVVARLDLVPVEASDLLVGAAFTLLLWVLLRGRIAFPGLFGVFARYGAGASFSLYVLHYPRSHS